MARALDDVIECIMDFGEYPEPKRDARGNRVSSKATRRFDLKDWLINKRDEAYKAEFIVCMIIRSAYDRGLLISRERNVFESELRPELADSDIVSDRALQMAIDEREERS